MVNTYIGNNHIKIIDFFGDIHTFSELKRSRYISHEKLQNFQRYFFFIEII